MIRIIHGQKKKTKKKKKRNKINTKVHGAEWRKQTGSVWGNIDRHLFTAINNMASISTLPPPAPPSQKKWRRSNRRCVHPCPTRRRPWV